MILPGKRSVEREAGMIPRNSIFKGQEDDDDKPEGEKQERTGSWKPWEDSLRKEVLINRNQMVAHYRHC